MSRIVVCDTGPLLHLGEANILYLLHLAGDVFIPPVVATEYELNAPDIKLPDWVVVKELDEPYRKKTLVWRKQIDEGESAAIALTLQIQAEWLLSDDANARQFAESLGLEIHGSIGLLLWAVVSGRIENQSVSLNLLNALANSSLWISDRVLSQARKAIGNLYLA